MEEEKEGADINSQHRPARPLSAAPDDVDPTIELSTGKE
jgi:hypothetical protein